MIRKDNKKRETLQSLYSELFLLYIKQSRVKPYQFQMRKLEILKRTQKENKNRKSFFLIDPKMFWFHKDVELGIPDRVLDCLSNQIEFKSREPQNLNNIQRRIVFL